MTHSARIGVDQRHVCQRMPHTYTHSSIPATRATLERCTHTSDPPTGARVLPANFRIHSLSCPLPSKFLWPSAPWPVTAPRAIYQM